MGGAEDEAAILRSLARSRFDPALFSGVFTRGGGGPPPWLDGLISDPGGRALVYALSSEHRGCLLLSYAVRRALAAGHGGEVAAAGPALAAHYSVFHALLGARLAAVPAAAGGGALAAVAGELARSLCGAQHSYALAAAILKRVGEPGMKGAAAVRREADPPPGEPPAPKRAKKGGKDKDRGEVAEAVAAAAARLGAAARFRRLGQELELAAAAAHGPVVWAVRPWLVPPEAPPGTATAAAAVAALAAADPATPAAARAVVTLARAYGVRDDGGAPPPRRLPPLAVLRDYVALRALTARLFTPAIRLDAQEEADAVGLLALGSAAVEREEGEGDGGGDAPPSSPSTTPWDVADVPAAAAAITSSRRLALTAAAGTGRADPVRASAAAAAAAATVGAAAAGLLHAASVQLGSPDWWRTAGDGPTSGGGGGGAGLGGPAAAATIPGAAPAPLILLAAALPAAPALHGPAVEALGSALAAAGNARPGGARAVLDVLVALAAAGQTERVLEVVGRWAPGADPSLVRHFVGTVLGATSPPYSPRFAGAVLRLASASGVKRARGVRGDGGGGLGLGPPVAASSAALPAALLDPFASGAVAVAASIDPPLTAREAVYLRELGGAAPPPPMR